MARRRLKMLAVGDDIGLTMVLQVVSAVAAFAFQIVFLRTLTKEDSGLYFLAISYTVIASGIADFGIVAAVFPKIAVARGGITPAFKGALVLRSITLAAALLLVNGYLMALGKWNVVPYFNLVYISVVISSKATGIRQLFETIWRFRGRTYAVTLISLVDALLALGALWYLSHTGRLTLLNLVLVFTLSNLPGFVAVVVPIVPMIRASGIFRHRMPPRLYKSLAIAALPVAAMIVLGQTSAQLETQVIDNYTAMSSADIAAYNAAVRPLTALVFIATTLGFGLAPLISQQLKGVRSDYTLGFIASVGVRLIGVISLVIAMMCGLFSEQVMMLFGRAYVGEAYILRIFSVISGLTFLVVVLDQFLLALGKRKQALYGAMLNLSIALITEPLTIRWWGIRGMMYSKGAAVLCLILFQLWCLRDDVRRAAVRGIARLLPAAAVLAGALLLTAGDILAPALRVGIVAAALLGSFVAVRAVLPAELRVLRSLRVA